MGQAKQRGTYEQRVAQAIAANAALEADLHETASPMLKQFMEKQGLQRFRLFLGKHFFHEEVSGSFTASNEDVNARNEAQKQSLVDSILSGPNSPTGQEDHQH